MCDISSGALLGQPRGSLNASSTAGASKAFRGLRRGGLDGKSGDASSEAFRGLPRGRLEVSSRDTYGFMSSMWACRVSLVSVCANVAITGDGSTITTYDMIRRTSVPVLN
jgi:hypothetical protein